MQTMVAWKIHLFSGCGDFVAAFGRRGLDAAAGTAQPVTVSDVVLLMAQTMNAD